MVKSFKNYDLEGKQEVSLADFNNIMRDMGQERDMT